MSGCMGRGGGNGGVGGLVDWEEMPLYPPAAAKAARAFYRNRMALDDGEFPLC